MKLDFFMLADAFSVEAIQTGGSKVSIRGAGLTHASTDNFPFRSTEFVALARFVLEDADRDSPAVSVVIDIHDPSDRRVAYAQSEVTPAEQWGKMREGEERSAWIVCDLKGVPFQEEGIYRFVLRIRNRKIAERRFSVTRRLEDFD